MILADCQIVLPFKCVEGDYWPHWGNWATKGVQRVNRHKQYQKCVTFQLVSVEDLLEKVAEAQEEVYGYADGAAAWMTLTLIERFYSFWGLVLFVNGDV